MTASTELESQNRNNGEGDGDEHRASRYGDLNARDTTLVFASRAPQADIERLKRRMESRVVDRGLELQGQTAEPRRSEERTRCTMNEVQSGQTGAREAASLAGHAGALQSNVRTTGAAAVGAAAVGALALGSAAIGALAIGRLAVGAFAMRRGRIGTLIVENLEVRRLQVGELTVSGEPR